MSIADEQLARIFDSVVVNNEVVAIPNDITGHNKKIIDELNVILKENKVSEAVDGVQGLTLGGITSDVKEGNYKVAGRLSVSNVIVADDYFVFNYNKTDKLSPIKTNIK